VPEIPILSSSEEEAGFWQAYPPDASPLFDPSTEFTFRRCRLEYRADGQIFAHDLVLEDGLDFRHVSLTAEPSPNGTRIILSARKEIVLRSLVVWSVVRFPEGTRMIANGFQSWTATAETDIRALLPPLKKFLRSISLPYGDYGWAPTDGLVAHRKTLFRPPGGKDFFVECEAAPYVYFHWKQKNRMLSLCADVNGRILRGGQTLVFQWRRQWADTSDVRLVAPLTGFTTWYNFYNRIDENLVLRLIDGYRNTPMDVFQIDDGWQRAVGDWVENEKFAGGMGRIARAIRDAGFQAGIWLSPFVCQHGSEAFGRLKKRVVAGFNPMWAGWRRPFFYRYDPEDDELRRLFDRVLDQWGFNFVKLDFLYAAGLGDEESSAGERMAAAAEKIARAVNGRAKILACGLPCQAVGPVFDYWRMGPDVGPTVDLKIGRFLRNRERISTLNSLRNVVVRTKLRLDGRVGHDPDVFILRTYNTRLPDELRYSNFLINVICGDLVFTSDEPARYSPNLRRFHALHFPHRSLTHYDYVMPENDVYGLSFAKNGVEYAAWLNLTRRTVKVRLGDERRESVRNFASLRRYFPAPHPLTEGFDDGGRLTTIPVVPKTNDELTLPPFATRVFVVFRPETGVFVGGDGHVLPGCERDADGRRHPHAVSDACSVFCALPPGARRDEPEFRVVREAGEINGEKSDVWR
jgi:alpha-galactosidase